MKIKLDKSAVCPTRAHPDDAGLDIYAPSDIRWIAIEAGGSAVIDTGVHVEIPQGYVGMLKSKSGLNVLFGIVSEGVIDSGYTGSIKVKLYNHSAEPWFIFGGDKISQLVILPIITPEVEIVSELTPTERGDHGFGSTGR